MATTSYGAPLLPLRSAAGWLRARASAEGAELLLTEPADLAAAVIAAEAWCVLTGGSLSTPRHSGSVAVVVAAAILSRASGHALPNSGEQIHVIAAGCTDRTDHLLVELERLVAWASVLLPNHPAEALRRAALDLTAGGECSPWAEFAALLALAAENL